MRERNNKRETIQNNKRENTKRKHNPMKISTEKNISQGKIQAKGIKQEKIPTENTLQ